MNARGTAPAIRKTPTCFEIIDANCQAVLLRFVASKSFLEMNKQMVTVNLVAILHC